MQERKYSSICVVGPEGHGKSSLLGRFLYELGGIPQRQRERYKQTAIELGHPETMADAFACMSTPSERRNGKTEYMHYKQVYLSASTEVGLFDTPGSNRFIRNLLAPLSLAHMALFVVAIDDIEHKDIYNKALMCFAFGIPHVVVAINKIDKIAASEVKDAYLAAVETIKEVMAKVGFAESQVSYCGCDYNNKGMLQSYLKEMPTLLEALNAAPEYKLSPQEKSLPPRMPILDAYRIGGVGIVVIGGLIANTFKPGQTVVIEPQNVVKRRKPSAYKNMTAEQKSKIAKVFSLEQFHQSLPVANAPGFVGINLKLNYHMHATLFKRGNVIGACDNKPPIPCVQFVAQMVIPSTGAGEKPIQLKPNRTLVAYCGTDKIPCRIIEIIAQSDESADKKSKPTALCTGQTGLVRLECLREAVIEEADKYPQLGRMILMEHHTIIAYGAAVSVARTCPPELDSLIKKEDVAGIQQYLRTNPELLYCMSRKHHNNLVHKAAKWRNPTLVTAILDLLLGDKTSNQLARALLSQQNDKGITGLHACLYNGLSEHGARMMEEAGVELTLPSTVPSNNNKSKKPRVGAILPLAIQCLQAIESNKDKYANLEEMAPQHMRNQMLIAAFKSFAARVMAKTTPNKE